MTSPLPRWRRSVPPRPTGGSGDGEQSEGPKDELQAEGGQAIVQQNTKNGKYLRIVALRVLLRMLEEADEAKNERRCYESFFDLISRRFTCLIISSYAGGGEIGMP